jgi:hypothetical protein
MPSKHGFDSDAATRRVSFARTRGPTGYHLVFGPRIETFGPELNSKRIFREADFSDERRPRLVRHSCDNATLVRNANHIVTGQHRGRR